MNENLNNETNSRVNNELQKFRENEQRYRTLIEGILDYAVFTTDPNGFIQTWNTGAERIKGYTSKEAIGSHFSMLYPEEAVDRNEPMDHLHEALIEGSYRGEGFRRKKDGSLFLADVYIRPIFSGDKLLGFAKVVSNLDEKNKLIQEIDLSKNELIDIKEERVLREQFISTLSHDLRSPLAAVKLLADMILKDPSSIEKNCKRIRTNIDRTDKMIRNLLDANRIKIGKELPLDISKCELISLINEACEDYRIKDNNKIQLCSEDSEIFGYWDRDALKRVFENLVSNALKYGKETTPINIVATTVKDHVIVKIHNEGNPIMPVDLPRIFDQFHRSSKHEGVKGWGLGLTLVKGIIEAHKGKVIVTSLAVEGTTFTIDIPIDPRKVKLH